MSLGSRESPFFQSGQKNSSITATHFTITTVHHHCHITPPRRNHQLFADLLLSVWLLLSRTRSDRKSDTSTLKDFKAVPLNQLVLEMINSEVNNNGLGSSGTGLPIHHKQSPVVTIKKTALRDVQNENRSLIRNQSGNSYVLERRLSADAIKFSGTKRVAPECPANPSCTQSLSKNAANENAVCAGREFKSAADKSRVQDNQDRNADRLQLRQFHDKQEETPKQQTQMMEPNISCVSAFAPIPMASLTTFTPGAPSIPVSLGKPGNGITPSESNHIKTTLEVSQATDSKAIDQRRKEQFLHLQLLLKHCDESNHSEYIQRMLHMTTTELSRHALELEKRAIHLTIEEGREIKRMKELNVLGKSS